MRPFRRRVELAVIGLATAAAAVLAAAGFLAVRTALRNDLVADATDQAQFVAGALAPSVLDGPVTLEQFENTELVDSIELRGVDGLYVELVDEPYFSGFAFSEGPSPDLANVVSTGAIGWEWVDLSESGDYLVVGARMPSAGPAFYLYYAADAVQGPVTTLAQVLLVGMVVVVLLATLLARRIAAGVLRPVSTAAVAASQMADGDLSVRLPVEGEDEIADWSRAFNSMASSLEATIADLRRSDEAQRRFVGDVAHELRTPLTALVAEAEVLGQHLDHLPPDAARAGELLTSDVARFRRLVADLLEMSSLDAGAETVRDEEFDMMELFRVIIAARHPETSLFGPEMLVVEADRSALERIIGNLLDNAASHAAGKDVDVEVSERRGLVAVGVLDRGPGVPPEDLAHLFDRFWKGDRSRSSGGTGLGLAIAAEHAARLGGDLAAANRGGGGLSVTLTFPVTRSLPAGDVGVTALSDAEGTA